MGGFGGVWGVRWNYSFFYQAVFEGVEWGLFGVCDYILVESEQQTSVYCVCNAIGTVLVLPCSSGPHEALLHTVPVHIAQYQGWHSSTLYSPQSEFP